MSRKLKSAIAVVWIVAATLAVPAPAQYFENSYVAASPLSTSHSVLADLDGNGHADLLVVDFAVFRYADIGNGGPSQFPNPGLLFQLPLGPWSNSLNRIAASDFDGDGLQDVLVGQTGTPSSTVYFLPGNGVGGVGPHSVAFTVAGGIIDLQSGDFDGDGMDELAVMSQGSGSTIYFNVRGWQGGSWANHFSSSSSAISIPGFPPTFFVGDFNGDGYDDACWDDTTVLPGGAGGLGPTVTVPGLFHWSVGVGDVDADGMSDLVRSSTSGGSMEISFGNPTGFLDPPVSVSSFTGPPLPSVIVADIDVDGLPDLLRDEVGSASFTMHRGLGGRAWSAPYPGFATTLPAGWAHLDDLDADGECWQSRERSWAGSCRGSGRAL